MSQELNQAPVKGGQPLFLRVPRAPKTYLMGGARGEETGREETSRKLHLPTYWVYCFH